MAKYGSDDVGISIASQNLSGYIDTFNGLEIEAMLQESHAFGDSWVEQLFSGVRRGNEFTVEGFYDDDAAGPDATLGGTVIGTAVAVVVTWGGSKTSTFSALVRAYRRLPSRGESTRFGATLVPSGAITEA